VIASIAFRDFKALRNTQVKLAPFNLVIGPNGSGKTSLIESILRLRTLSQLALDDEPVTARPGGPAIEFGFRAPYDRVRARLLCVGDDRCDALRVEPAGAAEWAALRVDLATVRSYVLEHDKLARPAKRGELVELAGDGRNLAAVLADLRRRAPEALEELTRELLRIVPEFRSLELTDEAEDKVGFALRLEENGLVPAEELSQGMLYLIGVLALAFDPDPPRVLCIEEVDRGIHPRMFREIRDALYRLSYPQACGWTREPVQVVATTHSPYFIDLFRDHPEEVIISQKHGRAAVFTRLADRPDVTELLAEGSLGEMWFSGILGGVPEERRRS
jgi:predicted ATPase